jgi:hypothetical protein
MPVQNLQNKNLEDHTKMVLACDQLNETEKCYLAGILNQVHHMGLIPVAVWRDGSILYFEYRDKNEFYWRIHFNPQNIVFPKDPSKCSGAFLAEKYFPDQIIIKFFNPAPEVAV